MIEIKIDGQQVTRALERLSKASEHAAPVMQNIAGIMRDAVEENFAKGGRPHGPA